MAKLKVYSGKPILNGEQISVMVAATSRPAALISLAKCGIHETIGHMATHWFSDTSDRLAAIAMDRPGVVFKETSRWSGEYVELPVREVQP